MKLSNIFIEALKPHQEQDAVRITHDGPNAICDTRSPRKHADLVLNPKWKEMREEFLSQHPEAQALFAKGGEKREYQIRFKRALHIDQQPTTESKTIFGKVCQYIAKVPNVVYGSGQPEVLDQIHQAVVDGNLSQQDSRRILETIFAANGNVDFAFNNTEVRKNYQAGLIVFGKYVGVGEKKIIKLVTFSIGKLLQMNGAPPDLIHRFNTDKFRQLANKFCDIIITGHPIDIYGGSTGRGWTSCSNVGEKADELEGDDENYGDRYGYEPENAAEFLGHDIHNQVHMAYLVPEGGDIDNDAIGRISYKPHHKLGGVGTHLMSENRVYGTAPPKFLQTANEIMQSIFKLEDGMYIQHKDSYVDDSRLKVHGKVKFNFELIRDLRREFDELTDEYTKDDMVSRIVTHIGELGQHDFNLILDTISSRMQHGLDDLEHMADDISDDEEAQNFFYEVVNLDRFMESEDYEYDNMFVNSILRGIAPTKKFSIWWSQSSMFANMLHIAMENVFEYMSIDDGDSNMDDLFGDFTTYLRNGTIHPKSEHAKSFKLISHGFTHRASDVTRKMVYLFTHFPAVCKVFDWSDFKITDGTAMEQATMVFTEFFGSVKEAEGELTYGVVKELAGLSQVCNEFTNSTNKTLDWLVELEQHAGAEEVSEIDGLHTYRDWLEQYIHELNVHHTDVVDGKVVIHPSTEETAKLFIESLKKNCSKHTTVQRCIELVDSGEIDLTKMI